MDEIKSGLSYIVPAYNEEKCILDTLERLKLTLNTLEIPFEVLLVNDGSRDNTKEIAQSVADVRVVNHPVNIGYGNALKTGILASRYEWIGIVDADGSYPIEEIPLLVESMYEGFDMVVGVRNNINDVDSLLKRLFRFIYKKIICTLNDSRIEDANSGLRIFKKSKIIPLFPFLCGTFSFTTSMSILTSGLHYFIKYVPITYSKRIGNSKVRHFRDSLRTMMYILQGIIFFNPIKFFLFLACLMIVVVCFPAMVIAMFHHPILSLYYMIFGTAVFIMISLGALGDIIRISLERHKSNFNPLKQESDT